jgi:hypothetical protein
LTAAVSIATAIAFLPALPKLLAMSSPGDLDNLN